MSASSWFKKKKDKAQTKGPLPNGNSHSVNMSDENSCAKASPAKTKVKSSREPEKISETDSRYVEAALRSLGTEPPHVARSTPQGQPIDTSGFARRQLQQQQHCLHEPQVYDDMLQDSLNACEMLQHNLDELITQVRQPALNEVDEAERPTVNGPKANGHPSVQRNSSDKQSP